MHASALFPHANHGNAPGTTNDNIGAAIAGYAHALLEHLEKSGHDPAHILGEHATSLRGSPASQRLGGQVVASLLQQVQAALDDPVYPLRLAAHLQPRHLGLVGYLAMASATLADAAQVLQRFEPLLDHVSLSTLSVEGEHVHMTWLPLMPDPSPAHIMFGLGVWVHQARALTGRSDLSCDAEFTFDAPARPEDLALFQATFGGEVRFRQANNRLIAPAAFAWLALQDANAEVHARLLALAEAQLAQLASTADGWLGVVEHTVRRLLAQGRPTLDEVANSLGLAPRTLQHRLDQEGVRFRETVDRLTRERAEHLLQQPHLTVAEVAARLGFANQSAFHHAFKRWTGQPPGAWRRAPPAHRP